MGIKRLLPCHPALQIGLRTSVRGAVLRLDWQGNNRFLTFLPNFLERVKGIEPSS
jgi:hypothetical protein